MYKVRKFLWIKKKCKNVWSKYLLGSSRAAETDGSERSEHAGCEELSGCEECETEDWEESVREDMACDTNGDSKVNKTDRVWMVLGFGGDN